MSDQNDDKTVVLGSDAPKGHDKGNKAGGKLVDTPTARLICVDPSQIDGSPAELIVPLVNGATQTIGRGDASSFVIASRKLSRQHARLFPGVGAWGVEDMNSTNGVYVNGHKISTTWLKHADEVRLGSLAFRYELDRPMVQADRALSMPTPAHQDDDVSDRTMMVGSLGAGKAVLEAVRKIESQPKRPIDDFEDEAEPKKPSVIGKILVRTTILLGVLGVLGAGGAFYYPIYKKQQDVATTIDRSALIRKRVIDRAIQYTGGGSKEIITFEHDLNDLEAAIEDSRRFLASEQNAKLADVAARMQFLAFEREFLPVFLKGDIPALRILIDRLNGNVENIAARATPGADHLDTEGLAAVRELVKLAGTVTTFRAFALEFPQVSKLAPVNPPKDRVQMLETVKTDFTRIRRASNRFLSVDYILFNSIVKVVEEKDMALLNQWKEFLGSNP